MKTILSSLFIMGVLAFSSFSVNAGNSHLEEAIQHTEAATEADGAKSIAQHAEEAKTHANAARAEKSDDKHLQEGLKCLDDATREARDGKTEEARKAVTDALEHFKQAR